MSKLKLPKVTLLVIDCFNYALAIASIKKSVDKVDFGAVKFLTDANISEPGIEIVLIPAIKSKNQYSQFILKEAYKYIDTEFVLVAQHDSWVLNADCFDERLYDCDYAGALWLESDGLANGNGGLSWRSFKLMQTVGQDKFVNSLLPEDVALCRVYRSYLEKNYGLVWASDEVCETFSFELRKPIQRTFAFHSYFHEPYKPYILLKRTASLGDLIMLEPVISYYSEKGYQVVIDTIMDFMQVFARYRYKLLHVSQMDSRIIPEKSINFDLSYERTPKQLALKSYIELTGEPIVLRNSVLNFDLDPKAYFFEKLILIHADETGMTHRNCQGVNWSFLVSYYTRLGYQVFQIGKRMNEVVAPYLNTINVETLMFIMVGAKLFIGIDSSPLQIAIGLGIPSVGLFGSVKPDFRYLPSENIIPMHTPCIKKETDFCYHSTDNNTTGVVCKYDKDHPPCVQFSEYEIIRSANKLLKI